MTPDQKRAHDFAVRMISLGFHAYLAKTSDYGFITDSTESRVMSFSGRDGSLSGNYGPPSQRSGTGWRLSKSTWHLITAADVREALYEHPFPGCGDGWKYFTTVKQHLALYGSSSGYARVTDI